MEIHTRSVKIDEAPGQQVKIVRSRASDQTLVSDKGLPAVLKVLATDGDQGSFVLEML